MGRPEIRPARAEDLLAFYGEPLQFSVRALVVELDEEIVAVAGIARHEDSMTAFSEIRDPLRDYPLTIWRTGRKLMELINNHGGNVYAEASQDESNSLAFLQRLGFTHVGDGLCKI